MSEKDNSTGIFLLGTLVGGTIGALVGVFLTNRNNNLIKEQNNYSLKNKEEKNTSNSLGLEDKISQLNNAIDDVRVTLLKNVNAEKDTIKN